MSVEITKHGSKSVIDNMYASFTCKTCGCEFRVKKVDVFRDACFDTKKTEVRPSNKSGCKNDYYTVYDVENWYRCPECDSVCRYYTQREMYSHSK